MSVSTFINSNLRLKRTIHRMLIPKNEARPRLWVKLFVNRFFHSKGRGVIIRSRTRIDVLPFNKFIIGDNSIIEDFCTVNNGVGDITIGNNTLIGISNVIIGPVHIGNNIIMAQNIVVSGLNHEYINIDVPIVDQGISKSEIRIEDNCWIAANVVITAGVTIGRHSIVAAGSIVTKDVPAYSVVGGNPAKVIKYYHFEKKEWVRI